VITLVLISSFQSQDMATCLLNGHSQAVCHHTLNR
jgi:hypothetical protein